ncbi:MAG TPA: hypothetical protein DCW96_09580 [Stenotrophomonas sp.]|nr:hypothetical protein [Stenotrophomonas sp.]
MTARGHRLRNRLMLAFAVFALAVAGLFGLYVAVFVYSVEDRFFDAMLEQEAQQQLDQRATRGTWSPPRNAFMTIHDSPATFPSDLKAAFDAEPWRREMAGAQGRHYHLRAVTPDGAGTPGWLVAEVSQQLVVRPMRSQILTLLAWSGLAVVMIALLAGAWLARRTTRPLSKLASLVDGMAPDRLPVGFAGDFPDDEVGVLARGLDNLSGRVRAFIAREHAFTRDASHELRTPLAVIRSATEQLASEPGLSEAGRRQLAHVQHSARQLEQTVITLLTLAREEYVERDAMPLAVLPVLEQVVVEQAALLGNAVQAPCRKAFRGIHRRDAEQLQGVAIARGQRGTAHQVHLAAGVGKRTDFMAQQYTGEIGGRCAGRQPFKQAQCTHTEEVVQQPAGLAAALHALREGGGIERITVVHQAAEQAVLAQQGKQFAGHGGGKTGDRPLVQRGPLAVRAGQADLCHARTCVQAGQLRLFAAHHVRGIGSTLDGHARHEPDIAAGQSLVVMQVQGRSEIGESGRAGQVGLLDPPVAAADHAAEQDRPVRPALDQLSQHVGETAVTVEDAARAATLLDDRAGIIQPVAAQAAAAPVDRDHPRIRLSGRPGCAWRALNRLPACVLAASSSGVWSSRELITYKVRRSVPPKATQVGCLTGTG